MKRYNEDGREISVYSQEELERMQRLPGERREMSDEERAAAKTEIPVSLYDDFSVSLEDVFWNVDAFQ